MKNLLIVSVLFWQFSCTNSESKNVKEIILDYPLVEFYVNDSVCNENISLESNKHINDLKMDTSSSNLLVSFDIDSFFSEVDFASTERRLVNKYEMTFCDTIFLNYSFRTNAQITKLSKKRFYYRLTDVLSYKHCIFIPREIY